MKLDGFSDYEIYPETGQIWSYKRNRFIGRKHPKKGYWFVALTDDYGDTLSTSLHRVVWMAVNGVIPDGYQVNHIDENRDNNRITNLNLKTPKENSNYGTRRSNLSCKNSKPIIALKNDKPVLLFNSVIDAKDEGYYVTSKILKGEELYKGYKWRYVKEYLNIP